MRQSRPQILKRSNRSIKAELDALTTETDSFITQLDAMWREDTAEIDAWLAKEKAELDAAFPDLTLSAILRDTASLVPDWPTLPNDWP